MTKVLVPAGVLGLGFDPEALERGLSEHPDIICIDGGSTDSGPFYLGTGTSKYSRAANKAEWKQLMQARAKAGVPLVIGSAGTCGSDSTVEWMYQITTELAAELGQSLKIARLYSSQPAERVVEALDKDRITPSILHQRFPPKLWRNVPISWHWPAPSKSAPRWPLAQIS